MSVSEYMTDMKKYILAHITNQKDNAFKQLEIDSISYLFHLVKYGKTKAIRMCSFNLICEIYDLVLRETYTKT